MNQPLISASSLPPWYTPILSRSADLSRNSTVYSGSGMTPGARYSARMPSPCSATSTARAADWVSQILAP